jgi:UDP-galactose transporter B1
MPALRQRGGEKAALEKSEMKATAAPALGGFSQHLNLLVCVVGIYACYLWYGVVQEALYQKQEDGTKFGATAFVMLVQCLGNAGVAAVVYVLGAALGLEKRVPVKNADGNPEPLLSFGSALVTGSVLTTSLVYVLAMYTSNEALKYVSYPMQALAKSCKLVPVLIGGMIINGNRHPAHKYVSVALVTAGITAFQFSSEKRKAGGSSGVPAGEEAFGLTLLAVSLAMDGMSGPGQERIKVLALTNSQQMMATNVWATLVMAAITAAYSQMGSSVSALPALAPLARPTPLTTPPPRSWRTWRRTPPCGARSPCSPSRLPWGSSSSFTPFARLTRSC